MIGVIIGTALLLALAEEFIRLTMRNRRRVKRLGARFGLSNRDAKRFDHWLSIQHSKDWWADDADMFRETAYERWAAQFLSERH